MPLHLVGDGDIRSTVLDYLTTDDGTLSSPTLTRSTYQERLLFRANYWRHQHTGSPPPEQWEFPHSFPANTRDTNPSCTFDRFNFACDEDSGNLDTTLLIPWAAMSGKTRAHLYVGGLDWVPLTAHMIDAHRIRKSMGLHQQVYNSLRGLEILVQRPVGRLRRRLHSGTYSTEAAYITESIPKLTEVEIGRICRAISEPTSATSGAVLPDGPLVFTFRACLGRMWSSCDTHGVSVDGDGVNVILGNSRVIAGELPSCRLWLTDVDRCQPLQFLPHLDLNQMATAVICNPCWPLPPGMPCFQRATPRQRSSLASVWHIFSNAYLAQSDKLMQVRVAGYECSETSYPTRFIDYMDALVMDPPASLNVQQFLAPFDPQYQPIPFQATDTRHLYQEEGVTYPSRPSSMSAELVDETYTETTDSPSPLSWAIVEEEACFSPAVLVRSGE